MKQIAMKSRADLLLKIIMPAQGLLWLAFVLWRVFDESDALSTGETVLIILMALNAILFVLLSRLYRKALLLKIVTALFLAVNLILTFTDQMGLFDYIVLALNIVTSICFMIAVTKGRQKNES